MGRQANMALLALVLAMMSIQSGAALAKSLFPLIGPVGTTSLRLFFAAIFLCAVFRPWRSLPARGQRLSLLLYGAALGGMNVLFYLAIERIPLGVAIALEFTGPLVLAFASVRAVRDMVWVLCAVAGVALLLPVSEFSADLDPLGVAYALAAGVGWALYIVFGQRCGQGAHGGQVVALGMCVASVLYSPLGFVAAPEAFFSMQVLWLGVCVAVFSSAIPYTLEMVALTRLSRQTFSILMSMEPAIGALSGLVWLGERLSLVQCVAIALVVAASLASTRTGRRQPVEV